MPFVVNQEDVKAFVAELTESLNEVAKDIVGGAAKEGSHHLHDFDEDEGHKALAQLWDYTEPEMLMDGSWMAETFSHAETMTFYGKTSRPGIGRVKSSKYPIEGMSLLTILESGAKAHEITATGNRLAIPQKGFEEAVLARSHGIGEFTPGADAFYFPVSVEHPGVQGNENIERTFDMMEAELEARADDFATDVAHRMEGR